MNFKVQAREPCKNVLDLLRDVCRFEKRVMYIKTVCVEIYTISCHLSIEWV